MIKNYIKIAWRNLQKNKLFSGLNILGLSLGLCVFMLLSLFIIQERSFNDFPKKENIFRFLAHTSWAGQTRILAGIPNAVGPTVAEERPEVIHYARTLLNDFGQNANINIGQDTYIESALYWADPEITDIFDLRFVQGDAKTALRAPNEIVLSASKAKQYFGDDDPIGKTIELNRNQTLIVTGVYADLPATSTFNAELIGSYSSTGFHRQGNSWSNASFETWVMLASADDAEKVEASLQPMIDTHVDPESQYYTLSLQALQDMHMGSSDIRQYSDRRGDMGQLKQLSYLALALLLIAAINYMNLSTARAQQRSKEVGVSKTLGASRVTLIGKFYAETAILTFIAMFIGVVMAILTIPVFNAVSGKELMYNTLTHPVFCLGLPVLWALITLLSGIYPAVILSSFSPIAALQKGKSVNTGSVLLRKGLVVVQFSASIMLIVGVIVMYTQMDYVGSRKLGYNPENVIAIGLSSAKSREEVDVLQHHIGALGAVESMSLAQAFPGKGESGRSLHKENTDAEGISLSTNRISGAVADVLQLDLLAGRMLTDRAGKDDSLVQVVLNKYAVDHLGWTADEAIGKRVNAGFGDNAFIVGVVDNFNYASLRNPIGAYAFNNAAFESYRYLMVRFRTSDLRATMQQFEATYKKCVPDAPFDYTFLDSHLENLYQADRQTAAIMLIFSILAVMVGCLGLFGLAAFTAEKRTKEIGIRKVLGATVFGIVRLLSVDFVKLVGLASIIACPIAYWLFSEWLAGFSYRIEIQWWMLGTAGLIAVVIALVTVSSQAIKAGVANPVESLRDE